MKRVYLIVFSLIPAYLAFSQREAGLDKVICKGQSVKIGTPDTKGYCYVWEASPGLINRNLSEPLVTPITTTTYKLTIVGQDFSFKRMDEVVITVIENISFTPSNAIVASGATPKIPLAQRNAWGYTDVENIEVDIFACSDGKKWNAVVNSIKGNYSEEYRLVPGVQQVTGPVGNTTQTNFCDQVTDLKSLACPSCTPVNWYMIEAVKAHEDVHASRIEPAIEAVVNNIESLIETVSIPDNGETQQEAITKIKASLEYKIALAQSVQQWNGAYEILIVNDHTTGGPTDIAEEKVVNVMTTKICNHAKIQMWGLCASCPP